LANYLQDVNRALVQGNRNVLTQTSSASDRVKKDIKQLRRKHLDDLSAGNIPPQVSVAFLATLTAYSRVRDHSQIIAETVSGEK
jgi:phosphate:Na+ symporter